ncbi:oxidoreductase [Paenibacillus cisolokensis]|uniref:Thermophilic NAD(P)H-flavin oxidoreductase n=2 Tax=Paenibacillus TaxID=44249 RepID=Q9FAE6_9BACL|nr:nitroreductase family protein [Paenibacillus cisolokensis]BAB13707.1 thermophilic NAD(P)H-flavin oxidoreductase [Paenibacillus sp. A11-2]GIQ63216.1 oxidoreductase [Paenibacillus cisolokensis]
MSQTAEQSIAPIVAQYRHPEQPISPLFVNRWSSRAFDSRPVDREDLLAVLEAARWAPSSLNDQPWRFLIAETKEQLEKFYSFIAPGNLTWCTKAPVLLLVMSKTTRADGQPNRAHVFDTGAAWGYLALEAARRGLITRAMGGFDAAKARETLGLPDDLEPRIVVALGHKGNPADLPEQLQEREKPTSRLTVDELIWSAAP